MASRFLAVIPSPSMAALFYHDALTALSLAGTRFVVVGGMAVNLQGVQRATADLDIAIALDAVSLRRAVTALGTLGLRPILPVQLEQIMDPAVVQSWIDEKNLRAIAFHHPNNPLQEIDLLVAELVPYEEIEKTADKMTVGTLSFAVASIPMLIRLKTGTHRAQDASDVEALRKIQEAEANE